MQLNASVTSICNASLLIKMIDGFRFETSCIQWWNILPLFITQITEQFHTVLKSHPNTTEYLSPHSKIISTLLKAPHISITPHYYYTHPKLLEEILLILNIQHTSQLKLRDSHRTTFPRSLKTPHTTQKKATTQLHICHTTDYTLLNISRIYCTSPKVLHYLQSTNTLLHICHTTGHVPNYNIPLHFWTLHILLRNEHPTS